MVQMYRTERILDANPELRKQWTALVPQGRLGQPVDLMGSVAFLLSEASQYVTGAGMCPQQKRNSNFTNYCCRRSSSRRRLYSHITNSTKSEKFLQIELCADAIMK
jgi:hypothetical protein